MWKVIILSSGILTASCTSHEQPLESFCALFPNSTVPFSKTVLASTPFVIYYCMLYYGRTEGPNFLYAFWSETFLCYWLPECPLHLSFPFHITKTCLESRTTSNKSRAIGSHITTFEMTLKSGSIRWEAKSNRYGVSYEGASRVTITTDLAAGHVDDIMTLEKLIEHEHSKTSVDTFFHKSAKQLHGVLRRLKTFLIER